MLKSAASKVMWLGRATVFLIGVAVIVGLTVGLTSTVFAQNQSGQGVFRLAATNTANAVSSLVNTGSGPALDLQVQQGQAPMTVNSDGKVANLNADTVDGKDSSQFANSAHAHSGQDITTGTVAEPRIDGAIAHDNEVMPIVKANDGSGSDVDADTVDGLDSEQLRGQQGPPGTSGVSGYEIVKGPNTSGSAGARTTSTAECPDGKRVIGGGFGTGGAGFSTYYNGPPLITAVQLANDKWTATIGGGPNALSVEAYAICANVN